MTRLQILKTARKLVAKGWTQKVFRKQLSDGTLQFCALGAIRMAVWRDGCPSGLLPTHAYEAQEALCAALSGKQHLSSFDRIACWNDSPKRKQRDVLAAFDRAIALVGAKQKKQ